MRHLKAGRRLGRTTEHRLAMLRNLVTALLEKERVETTRAKAKEARMWAEKVITLAKRGDLHARRLTLAVVRSKKVVAKLFSGIAGAVSGPSRGLYPDHPPGGEAGRWVSHVHPGTGGSPRNPPQGQEEEGRGRLSLFPIEGAGGWMRPPVPWGFSRGLPRGRA